MATPVTSDEESGKRSKPDRDAAPLVTGMTAHQQTLWIASEIFYPEETSTGYILTRLAEGLGAVGRVRVLCAQPSYERKGHQAPEHERVKGIEITRARHPRYDRSSLLGRAVNVFVVTFRMFIRALREFKQNDMVIVVTNPPLLPFAIYVAATMRGTSIVLLVHDLYPEAAILSGVLRKGSLIARLWRSASDWLLRHVDRIVVLGRDSAEVISARLADGMRRIRVIGNWADVDDVRPEPPASNALLKSLGLTDRFVLGYAGNIGRVHDIELLVAAARMLRIGSPDVHFLFIGNGAKDDLVAAIASEPGTNVSLLGPLDRSEQNLFLNACHVSIMALAPGMAGIGVPSRLYNVLAAGRAVVAAVDVDSEPARIIREERIGAQTPPGDLSAFVRAIESICRDESFLVDAGCRARRAAVERFSFARVLGAYRELLAELGWQAR